jgi:hypothetical protein
MDVTGRSLPPKLSTVSTNHVEHPHAEMLDMPIDFGSERSFYTRTMAYRVEINGSLVVMDNPREVFELLKEAKRIGLPRITMTASEEPGKRADWTADLCESFRELIRSHGHQIEAINSLLRVPDWILKGDLITAMGFADGQQLGGCLSGISKNAKKMGLPPVFEMERLQVSGVRTSRYRLTTDFRAAVMEMIEQRNRRRREEEDRYRDDQDIPNGGEDTPD